MSMLCAETLRKIRAGEPLWILTRRDADSFAALSHAVLMRVPPELRRNEPCPADEKGFDVHRAAAGVNPIRMTYSWSDGFEKKEFVFSVSEETARRYLPVHWGRTYDPNFVEPVRPPDIVTDAAYLDALLQEIGLKSTH